MIRILIADDHKIVRDGLRSLLEKQKGLQVVGEADNGRIALRLLKELKPDIIIMDIAMPDMNGIDATRQIMGVNPDVRVIALSMHSDKRYVTKMLQAGAVGYLLKDNDFEDLSKAILAVMAGKIYLGPEINEDLIADYLRIHPDSEFSVLNILTQREIEVLRLLSEGKTSRAIADALHLSVKTVETYRKQIMDKLNVHTVAELTKYALREGLTTL
ncbi:MAG TPA: response regulator transcription factor [Thermodesulfovibrionales bacterium]|nr:response regulator transcription factor [Thermodesulfovibrionales bacterium]